MPCPFNGMDMEAKRSKALIIMFFFDIEAKLTRSIFENWFQSEANMFILKNLNIEAKRTGSIVILYLNKRKKANFPFFKTKGKKRKCSLVNYRSFAITMRYCIILLYCVHCKSGSFDKYLNQLYSTDQIAMVWFCENHH